MNKLLFSIKHIKDRTAINVKENVKLKDKLEFYQTREQKDHKQFLGAAVMSEIPQIKASVQSSLHLIRSLPPSSVQFEDTLSSGSVFILVFKGILSLLIYKNLMVDINCQYKTKPHIKH